jgi:hypothetical protein
MEYFIVQWTDSDGIPRYLSDDEDGAPVYFLKKARWFISRERAENLARELNGQVRTITIT